MAKFVKEYYIKDNAGSTNVELDNASATQVQTSNTNHEVKQNTTLEHLELIQIVDHDGNMVAINTSKNQNLCVNKDLQVLVLTLREQT